MHLINWNSDFALGIDAIDDQHKTLVDMINALDASSHEEYSAEHMRHLLDRLNAYVKEHFGFEERLMAGGGCTQDLVARHFGEHAYFRSVLRDLTADFENGRTRITVTLIEYLVHWLLHHITVVDSAMVRQLHAAEPEIKARVAAALTRGIGDDLSASERHLLTELRRASEELEHQVDRRTRELRDANCELQAELDAARAEVQRLKAELAATAA